MEKLRGLYRYQPAPGRWWACAESENGQRVNVTRERYENAGIEPPFWDLPGEHEGAANGKATGTNGA